MFHSDLSQQEMLGVSIGFLSRCLQARLEISAVMIKSGKRELRLELAIVNGSENSEMNEKVYLF